MSIGNWVSSENTPGEQADNAKVINNSSSSIENYYESPGLGIRIKIPEGWRASEACCKGDYGIIDVRDNAERFTITISALRGLTFDEFATKEIPTGDDNFHLISATEIKSDSEHAWEAKYIYNPKECIDTL